MSKEQDKARVTAFEKDLADLYAKHRLVITSCGCCGGCWITPEADEAEAREWAESMRFEGKETG